MEEEGTTVVDSATSTRSRARRPLVLGVGEPFTLDFRALGVPDRVTYQIYRHADYYPTTPDGRPTVPDTHPLPVRQKTLPPGLSIPLSIDLPPDRYLLGLFATYPGRDTYQGFHLILAPSSPAGTPVA